jgi:hypothetical protein
LVLCKAWAHASFVDIVYVIKHENRMIPKLQMILKAPIINILAATGQYMAVHDEIRGTSKTVHGV